MRKREITEKQDYYSCSLEEGKVFIVCHQSCLTLSWPLCQYVMFSDDEYFYYFSIESS